MRGEGMRAEVSILPLALDRLRFEADGRTLIDDVDLVVERGGLTVFLGPNGAGKSLLLRLAHGLVAPTSGEVRWGLGGGEAAGRKRHAMVFQKPVMLRRSVRENLVHALAASGVSRRDRDGRADEALSRFGLREHAGRAARLLSGGEQQRLAVARAWALDPEVLFLDEPTSHLDPSATRTIEAMLGALLAEGRTLVMATHDLGQARRLATRIVLLLGGRIVEDAPAGRFFEHPSTEAARAFLAGDLVW